MVTFSLSGPLPFHKGLSTLSALISARNSLHMCEEWHICDRAIDALVRGRSSISLMQNFIIRPPHQNSRAHPLVSPQWQPTPGLTDLRAPT